MPVWSRPMHRLPVLLAASVLAACTTPALPPKATVGRTPAPVSQLRELPGPPGLPAALLGSVASAEAPVAFAAGPKGALFAFVDGGRLMVRPVGPGLVVPAEAQSVAAVGDIGTGMTLRSRGDGTFLLFWGERVDDNHVFKLQRVGADGKVVGGVLAMPPIAEAGVTFADIGVVGERVVVVHEITNEDRMSVYVTALAPALDRVEGAPKRVVTDALSWYPALSSAGLGLVAVMADDRSDQPTQIGRLELVVVDASGKITAQKPIISSFTAQIDAEIAAVDGGYVVAWTDVGQGDGAVRVATLGPDGALTSAPAWVAPPIGQQALVSVTSAPDGRSKRALVAWENVGQTSDDARVIHLATVDGKGAASKERARMSYVDEDRPWIIADGDGFAALTVAPATASDDAASPGAPTPTLVRLGADLSVRWAEPIRFAQAPSEDGVPAFALEPACAEGACYALAADGPGPLSYYAVSSAERQSPWRAPVWKGDEERAPKVVELRSITEGPRLAGAYATRLAGEGAPEAVAWVTYFLEGSTAMEPAPKGEPPYAATLAVRFTQADGALSAPVEISKRALSVGGVSVTPAAAAKRPEAVVAWVAQDKTGPQVYATKVDVDGKKVAQKKVTTVTRGTKGKTVEEARLYASSVSIASSPSVDGTKDGFVLAWVDTRDKNGELYVARLNKDLEKSVSDKRITSSPGDASDVSVAVRGQEVFVAFADSREGKPSDIYFSHLDALTLKELDDDGRVYASSGRSRAPRVALAGKKILLAWIEEDVSASPKPATLKVAEIDAAGRLAQPPRTLSAPGNASITGFSLTCADSVESCRLALSWGSKDGRTEIGAATLDATGVPSEVRRLGTLASGPFAEPSFAFGDRAGGSLYYAEDLGAKGRLRQLKLGW